MRGCLPQPRLLRRVGMGGRCQAVCAASHAGVWCTARGAEPRGGDRGWREAAGPSAVSAPVAAAAAPAPAITIATAISRIAPVVAAAVAVAVAAGQGDGGRIPAEGHVPPLDVTGRWRGRGDGAGMVGGGEGPGSRICPPHVPIPTSPTIILAIHVTISVIP